MSTKERHSVTAFMGGCSKSLSVGMFSTWSLPSRSLVSLPSGFQVAYSVEHHVRQMTNISRRWSLRASTTGVQCSKELSSVQGVWRKGVSLDELSLRFFLSLHCWSFESFVWAYSIYWFEEYQMVCYNLNRRTTGSNRVSKKKLPTWANHGICYWIFKMCLISNENRLTNVPI